MTVNIGRWITVMGWLALMTVGKPAMAETDGISQSRYLGSMSETKIASSTIQTSRAAGQNPLRQNQVEVVLSGIDAHEPAKVIASTNAASLKLLPPDGISEALPTRVASAGVETARQNRSVAVAPAEGRILLGTFDREKTIPAVGRSLTDSLHSISRLVRSAYEPDSSGTRRGLSDSTTGRQSRVPASRAGYRRPIFAPPASEIRRRELIRPTVSNIDIFVVNGAESVTSPAASLGNPEQSAATREIIESEIFDDSACWFLDDRDLSPRNSLSRNSVRSSSVARLGGQLLVDEIAPTPLDSESTARIRPMGNRGLPAISISHSRRVPATSISSHSLYASFQSIAVAMMNVVRPLLEIGDQWRFQQRLESIYGMFKSAVWPTHMGLNLNTWGVFH